MAFNYRPKVDKKEEEIKRIALAKMPTLKPVSKATPIVKETKPTVKGPFDKDFKPVIPTFAPAEALAKKFLSSATLGLTDVIKTPYTEKVEEKAKTMPVASTVANVVGYLSPGTAGAKLVKPLLKNVTSKLGKQALEGAIVGTGITAAENVVPLLKGEKDIQQVGQEVGKGLVGGIALDVGLYGLGKLAKPLINKIRQGVALSQAEKQAVAQTLNVPVDSVDETVRKLTIQEELGLPKDMTAQQYQDKLQADAYVQSLKKSPQQIVDDFTSWRSRNFGGATGKMPPQDIKALKELYKEDTGIDFDTEFAQSKQDFTNEMGRGKQITTNRPTVKPVVEPPTPQPVVKPLLDTTQEPTLIPDVERPQITQPVIPKTTPEIQKLDADYKAEVERLKSNIAKGTTNRELAQKRIKQLGFEHAAEKRRLIQGDSFEPVQGGLTAKELADKVKKEQTNYVGKSVVTPVGEGKVIGQSFGKVGVEFEDGSKIYFVQDEVKAKFNPIKSKVEVQEPVITPKVEQPTQQTVKPLLQATESPTPKVIEQVDQSIEQTQTIATGQPMTSQIETPKVGESIGKFFKSAMKSEQIPETIKTKLAPLEEQFTLPTTSNEARKQMADKFVSDNKEDALRLIREGDKFNSSVEPFMADKLIKQLTDEGRDDDVIDVIESIAKKSRAAGQEVQAMSIWSKATPEGMQKWTLKTLEEGNVKPEVARETAKQVGEDMRRLQKETSPEELAKLVASKIKNKTERNAFMSLMANTDNTEQIRALGVAKIQADALNKIAVGTGRKLSTFQAMSHLLNIRTFVGNILGNVASMGMEGISNVPASAFDSMLSLATGKRTISSGLPKWQQGVAQGMKQGKDSMAEIMLGVNKVQKDKYDLLMGTTFDKVPVLREGEKLLSMSLNVPDEFFKGFAKANSLYDQVRARIGKEANNMSFDEILAKATPDEIQTAVDEAAYATFQNDSLPAQFLSKAKNTLNIIGMGKNSKTGIKEFGLGDLVIKYTRVPGNILSRGIEYSPAGAVKGLYTLTQVPNNPKLQRQAAQQLGRAFTGTSVMGLGYMLNKLGILSADSEKADPKELALKRAEGVQGNKINTSALLRLATGGDPTPKSGDTYKDFTWLQPLSVGLSVGANIAANDQNPFSLDTNAKTFEEVLDLPTLYTIKSMLYESQKEGSTAQDVLTVPLAEAIPGFVPSIVRQAAQTIDPVIRETKGKDIRETTKLKVMANIPGLSQKLEPKISPTGEELKRTGGIVSTMIDRSATTEYKPTGYTDKLQELKKLTEKATQFPISKAPNKVILRNTDIVLTPQEKTEYMKTIGSYVDREYAKLLSGKDVKNMTPREAESLVNRLEKIKNNATDIAKRQLYNNRQR